MVKSNYKKLSQSDARYRLKQNPLYALLRIKDISLAESFISLSEAYQIDSIIETELQQDFSLGGHPDFEYLLDNIKCEEDFRTQRENDIPLCIAFVDLRNFSKRALFTDDPAYETIDEIGNLKLMAVSTWIKLARYYQGHIHSITGDGIMVIFGGKQPYDQDTWAIGARAFLFALRILESEQWLNNQLRQDFEEKGLGSFINADNLLDLKVAIDYSPKTLINAQGVMVNNASVKKPVGEIKATSFEVDVCAKMLSYYKDVKSKIDGNPKLGRILLFGQQYKELMNFKEEVPIQSADTYQRSMYGQTKCYSSYYLDAKEYKDNILTLDDVAGLCDLEELSVIDLSAAAAISLTIARKTPIQHG